MREFIFLVFARANHLVSAFIQSAAEFIIFVNSELGCLLLKLIDKERFEHARSVAEQQDEISELEVMSNLSKVIDDAVKHGEWHEIHQHNINHLANVLFDSFDWDKDTIQETIGRMITEAEMLMTNADENE